MPPNEENGALERMREKLYQNKPSTPSVPEDVLSRTTAPVARGWEAAPQAPIAPPPHKRLPLPVKFFLGALVFFVVTGALTAAYLIYGGRSVSAEHVDILVVGPTTAASGDVVSLLVTVQNRNPVTINVKDLSIDFPPGSRDADDVDTELAHQSIALGSIESGSGNTKTVRATLFGSENQTLTIPLRVEYTVEGSNAVFVKNKEYEVTITTSPLSVNATSVTQTSSGQSVTFSLAVRANATEPLQNVALKAEYPFGFAVTSTSIDSRASGTFFPLGTLRAGEEKRFTVTGTLAGSNDDTRVFKWSSGTVADVDSGKLDIAYATAVSEVAITRPFIDVALAVAGDASAKPVIQAGKSVQSVLNWKNTLPASILDGKVTVTLSGTALDPNAVSTQNGFYQSSNLSILFDRDTNPDLKELEPGDTGSGTFSFASKKSEDMAGLQKPEITLTVSVAGRRVGETGVPETLTSTLTRVIKVATDFRIASKVVRTQGPFENSGPWPPTPGKETTYTVILTASNTVNDVAGGIATMTIPSYVRYTGLASPADGKLTYSEATRTITWNLENVAAHANKEVAFQIALLPSVSQKGSSPELVSAQKLSGTDRFTQTSVGMTAPYLNTENRSDPGFQILYGQVQ